MRISLPRWVGLEELIKPSQSGKYYGVSVRLSLWYLCASKLDSSFFIKAIPIHQEGEAQMIQVGFLQSKGKHLKERGRWGNTSVLG